MHRTLITLTTDFGTADAYVAAMKGVILSLNSEAEIVDLSHELPAHDVLAGAFFLLEAIPQFPAAAIHVVVVDPGVGTDRPLLYAELGLHRLLLPDNGLLTLLAQRHPPTRLIQLTNGEYWRGSVSSTFHGRDILAPVAAHLTRGLDPGALGPRVDSWTSLPIPLPHWDGGAVHGEVIHVDRFGNLITNIEAAAIDRFNAPAARLGARVLPFARTYGDRPQGEAIALASSAGLLEVAVVLGRACDVLSAGRGTAVVVTEHAGSEPLRNR